MTRLLRQIGPDLVAREALLGDIGAFLELYARRPFHDNVGGMRAPHLFAAWSMVRALSPSAIVESGVFKGLGTWLLENAAPNAKLFCIDPNLAQIVYRSPNATYSTADFAESTWDLPRESTLLFFDDHQDAFKRVEAARKFGFRHLIFEDNYPPGQGDCYSLKKAFMGEPAPSGGWFDRMRSALAWNGRRESPAEYLDSVLERYFEFPPVLRAERTRWNDAWSDERYPTVPPLLDAPRSDAEAVFEAEATAYTWICYARLRPNA